jgi:hydrogenase nickel incorporation protein HypA/HybF
MHELSVCQSLINQVNAIAAEHQASAVDKIYLQVGPLSGVVPELLQSAFPFARADTVAAGAELIIHALPVRVKCHNCQAETPASANKLVCGECGDWHTVVISGDELLLERVELRKEH